jgi:glycosyltransferase involved in cell wall biosynthesis
MLDQITPVLLTYNEDQNIGRTLSHLAWAKDIVVVDSGSTDGTLAVLARFPNVRVFSRRFDTHGNQWRYATQENKIATDWLLRLDADYQVSDALVNRACRHADRGVPGGRRLAFPSSFSASPSKHDGGGDEAR